MTAREEVAPAVPGSPEVETAGAAAGAAAGATDGAAAGAADGGAAGVAADTTLDTIAAETNGTRAEASPPGWSVQLFASSSSAVARARAEALSQHFSEALRVEAVAQLFKVRVGHCRDRAAAEALRRRALDLGFRDAFVVPPPAGSGSR